jgi:hypothetical protein
LTWAIISCQPRARRDRKKGGSEAGAKNSWWLVVGCSRYTYSNWSILCWFDRGWLSLNYNPLDRWNHSSCRGDGWWIGVATCFTTFWRGLMPPQFSPSDPPEVTYGKFGLVKWSCRPI